MKKIMIFILLLLIVSCTNRHGKQEPEAYSNSSIFLIHFVSGNKEMNLIAAYPHTPINLRKFEFNESNRTLKIMNHQKGDAFPQELILTNLSLLSLVNDTSIFSYIVDDNHLLKIGCYRMDWEGEEIWYSMSIRKDDVLITQWEIRNHNAGCWFFFNTIGRVYASYNSLGKFFISFRLPKFAVKNKRLEILDACYYIYSDTLLDLRKNEIDKIINKDIKN